MRYIILFSVLLLTGCADKVDIHTMGDYTQVGFSHGVWHGMILPFAFIASLFDSTVNIYAYYNNGVWYNLGFVLGSSVTLIKVTS